MKLGNREGFLLLSFAVILMLTACSVLAETAVLSQQSEPEQEVASAPDLSAYPWVYLRDGQPLTAGESVVELIAVGDVMLGRGVTDEPQPLANTAAWLSAADVTLGNLESVIVADGTPRSAPAGEPQPIILQAPVTAVSHLTTAGFDILSLANNHSLDFGAVGLVETAVRLHDVGIISIGAGAGIDAANEPHILDVNGLRLAFMAFNAVPEPGRGVLRNTAADEWQRADWDAATAFSAVTKAREQADAVIVSIHWGFEYEMRADLWQETAVKALFTAGADLVIGHHPHVVQGLQDQIGFPESCQTSSCFVAYSLGNFVFDQGQEATNQGLALRIFFDDAGLRAVQALPVWAGPRPRLMTLEEAAPLLARIQPSPPRIGFACESDNCQPVDGLDFNKLSPQEGSGLFWSGAVDLTGDGQPETIRRTGEQVTIYEAGTTVWTTPPEWRVVDVALGDPNDDGRFELLLAIWQTDAAGHDRSQPYIVGHRGGAYKLLWGGRPLNHPISEVELGDVDGNGTQELVVVEEDAIAVWRWQGWNFSLLWRSENGRYQDLNLIEENGRWLITVSQPY